MLAPYYPDVLTLDTSEQIPPEAQGVMNLLVLFVVAVTINIAAASSSLSVTPTSEDGTVFEQQQFQRVCRYMGPRSDIDTLQILHNGSVRMNSSTDTSRLDIMSANLQDAGQYECRVIFTDGEMEGPVAMGYLTVIDNSLVILPRDQYVVIGGNVTLQCSHAITMYGPVSSITKRGSVPVTSVHDAGLEDEGEYSCEVNLLARQASISMPFTLHVFTPITIISEPPIHNELTGVQRANFSVAFTGRSTQNITTMWYRNGILLESNEVHQLQTIFPDSMQGVASIIFPAIARDNNDVYRVEIRTEFGAEMIESHLRESSSSFQVDVEVLPPPPSNFEVVSVTEHRVKLRWGLSPDGNPLHPNEAADIIFLYLLFPNGTTASHTQLEGTATQVEVGVFPGVDYHATLLAENQDGVETSELYFTTPSAAPYISYFESRRVDETHFNVSISLLFTGGGDISVISVSFRVSSTTVLTSREWVQVSGLNLTPLSALEWSGVMSGDEFRGKGPLEFELTVENAAGFMNSSGPVLEKSDPPGIPTTPTVMTSPTSVVIDFNLPTNGTPPFIEVVIDFTEPSSFAKNFSGFFQPGQRFSKELDGLSPQTAYSLRARAVNYAGDGPDSQIISFTTGSYQHPVDVPYDGTTPTTAPPSTTSSPMSLFLPAIIGGVSLLVIIIMAVLLCCLGYCYCRRRGRRTNVYRVEKDTLPRRPDVERPQELEPDNEMLQRKEKVSVVIATPPSSSPGSLGKSSVPSTNTYTQIPLKRGEERAPSTASSSPWNHKRQLENNRGSSSTLNSGSVAQQSQDSFIKKSEIISTGSDYLSLQSSQQEMQSYRTSRDSLIHKRKIPNPSISSGGSGSTEMTDRYQTQSTLSPPVEETYSFTSMPFIPEGPYSAEEPSTPYCYAPHNQFASDV